MEAHSLLTTQNFVIMVYWLPSSLLFSFRDFLLKQAALYTHNFCVSVMRRRCLYSVLKFRINIFSVSILSEFIPVQAQLARGQLPMLSDAYPQIKSAVQSFGWLLHFRLWLQVKDSPGYLNFWPTSCTDLGAVRTLQFGNHLECLLEFRKTYLWLYFYQRGSNRNRQMKDTSVRIPRAIRPWRGSMPLVWEFLNNNVIGSFTRVYRVSWLLFASFNILPIPATHPIPPAPFPSSWLLVLWPV